MNDEPNAPQLSSEDAPPEEIGETDLLQDLRNLIVTEESESIRTLISIVGAIQARIEDRHGLVGLLKPVIAEVLEEKVREDPEELKKILAPIVKEIIREADLPEPARILRKTPRERLSLLLARTRERIRGLFSREAAPAESVLEEPKKAEKEPAVEICDSDFVLLELFLLARPSLVLLAHGSWRPAHVRARTEKQLLPLVRKFIGTKGEPTPVGPAPLEENEPLRAQVGKSHLHVERGRYAYLAVLYDGTPSVGFFLDLRQTLGDLHSKFPDLLRRAQAAPAYRRVVRLLLDRYRPEDIRIGGQVGDDPLTWPLAEPDHLIRP